MDLPAEEDWDRVPARSERNTAIGEHAATSSGTSTVAWVDLLDYVRTHVHQLIQKLLEAEIAELLGRSCDFRKLRLAGFGKRWPRSLNRAGLGVTHGTPGRSLRDAVPFRGRDLPRFAGDGVIHRAPGRSLRDAVPFRGRDLPRFAVDCVIHRAPGRSLRDAVPFRGRDLARSAVDGVTHRTPGRSLRDAVPFRG